MSTYNIGFYEELTKLSFNYHQIHKMDNFSAQQYQLHVILKQWVQKTLELHFFVFKSINKFCHDCFSFHNPNRSPDLIFSGSSSKLPNKFYSSWLLLSGIITAFSPITKSQ